jgi:hypothetical protein
MAREVHVTPKEGDDLAEDSTIASAIVQDNILVLINACEASEIRVCRSVKLAPSSRRGKTRSSETYPIRIYMLLTLFFPRHSNTASAHGRRLHIAMVRFICSPFSS